MTRVLLVGVLLVVAGCAPQETPVPPVPPVPLDLHQADWGWKPPASVAEPEPPSVPVPASPMAPKPNEAVYAWEPGTEYAVPVQIGWPVDIQFEPGERLAADVDGDRAYIGEEERRWQKQEAISGQEWGKDQQQQHLFFTCTHPGQRMGVMAATTRRMYYLALKCVGKSPVRVVRWEYLPRPLKPQPAPPRLLPDPAQPQQFQVGYLVTVPAGAESLRPPWVGNDQEHIYLIFPPTVLAEKAPMVREIGALGPSVVNSRQPAGKPVIVIDGLSPLLELRYGEGKEAQVVTITRHQLQQIHCPDDPQCPVWPHAGRPGAPKKTPQ